MEKGRFHGPDQNADTDSFFSQVENIVRLEMQRQNNLLPIKKEMISHNALPLPNYK